jgi:NADH-quinone oxidoreductase subunit L
MTAFYMFRLMAMTFFGAYRGPEWEAAAHGTAAPHDRPAGPVDHADHADHAHGHGPWHGPHESPKPMTLPLMLLAVGALVAGFVGIPAALGGSNTIERFLEPSFTANAESSTPIPDPQLAIRNPQSAIRNDEASPKVSRSEELGLMAFSVLIAAIGIGIANKFYVTSPEISDELAERFAGAHSVLSNKYYVDEVYDATVISGTFAAGRGLWTFDRNVVDGAVNGTSWATVISSWFSGLADRSVVDGLVNLVGRMVQQSSLAFRRFQTGLVQNYALLMLFGIFAFVGIYLFVR